MNHILVGGVQANSVESALKKSMILERDILIEMSAIIYMLVNSIYPEINESAINNHFFEKAEVINVIRIILANESLYSEVLLLCGLTLKEFIQMIVFLNYKILTYKIIANLKAMDLDV